ncbi:MUTYH isoform 12 [Pongo abelii]|uniref:MUTYH isoform 12 n=1 Tax=Pongo abelii TaxID=9601 RepID=A0A2J8SLU2_PONAB|nr:MUTYH isoform 12 [Pongo abelii]
MIPLVSRLSRQRVRWTCGHHEEATSSRGKWSQEAGSQPGREAEAC